MRGDHTDELDATVQAALFDALPDAAVLVDQDVRLVWGNAAASKLFGVSLQDGIGRSGLDFIHPDDLSLAAVSMTSVMSKDDQGSLLELRIRGAEGWRLVELRGAPWGDSVLLSLRDLTDRRRWEVAGDEVARLRSLTQNSSSLTMLLGADGIVTASSGALTRMLGVDQEWLEGLPFTELVDPRDRDILNDAIASLGTFVQRVPRRRTVDVRLQHHDGRSIPFAITLTDLLDEPTVEGILVTGHDVSDRVRTEADLREANSAFAATLESTADGIMVADSAGQVTTFNRRFVEMWIPADVRASELDEAAVLDVMAQQLGDPRVLTERSEEHRLEAEASSHDTLELSDGRIIERYSSPQCIDGRVAGRVWSFRDVTEHRRLAAELAHQAFHDGLTGLANQALFRDRVEHALARVGSGRTRSAVLFIDLDDFKRVNDSLGHSAGDSMLVTVGDRLSACLRACDTGARLGGDEFAVLIEDVADAEDATSVARRILEAMRQPISVGSSLVPTEASIGIAYGDADTGVDELLRNADLAMYTAKSQGKNCFRVFESAMHSAAVERLDLETHLRGAVGRGELFVEYQPVVELDSGRVRAMEALVRWQHPVRGLLGPVSFISFAEEGGLIGEIGHHVMVTACEEARRWSVTLGSAAPAVSVNLSPRQLADRELPDRIEHMLDRVGLEPAQLILEITEGELMRDPVGAVESLQRLSCLGIQLAVDDFGTGYSSLAYLQQFPIDLLKIDRMFMGAESADDSWSLALAIVQISHALGLTPIAEGVESQAQADVLTSFGCTLAQGYHLARPMSADAAFDLIIARSSLAEPARG